MPNRMQELIAARGLTMTEFAKIVGKDVATVSKHANNNRDISANDIKLYQKAFHLKYPSELFVKEEEES